MDTRLVKTGDLARYLVQTKEKHETIIGDCQKILLFVRDDKMKQSIEKQLHAAQQLVEALDKGYVPIVDFWGFVKVDTKAKWRASQVKEVLAAMPQEVKDVWEKVKATGFFDSFSVTVRGGGDPMLVGNKGRQRFLIGAWLSIAPGVGMGFVMRRQEEKLSE